MAGKKTIQTTLADIVGADNDSKPIVDFRGKKISVGHVYSSRTNVKNEQGQRIRGLEGLQPARLRLRNEEGRLIKGWIAEDDRFITEDQVRNLFYAVSQTDAYTAFMGDFNLTDAWDTMSMQEKLAVLDKVSEIDWKAFWEEFDSDGSTQREDYLPKDWRTGDRFTDSEIFGGEAKAVSQYQKGTTERQDELMAQVLKAFGVSKGML